MFHPGPVMMHGQTNIKEEEAAARRYFNILNFSSV